MRSTSWQHAQPCVYPDPSRGLVFGPDRLAGDRGGPSGLPSFVGDAGWLREAVDDELAAGRGCYSIAVPDRRNGRSKTLPHSPEHDRIVDEKPALHGPPSLLPRGAGQTALHHGRLPLRLGEVDLRVPCPILRPRSSARSGSSLPAGTLLLHDSAGLYDPPPAGMISSNKPASVQ